ncbi:ALA-interacting subunit [Citrus sinensis]|uniref:ALA-interacting subunit 1-like n=1 Tax=Citrus sinensis TaxID=2711 RepID=UPI0003D6E191|nr:ALA-interacting subunit 1-like [Citrus sinensis]KAH9670590.1 ALA-interacting subunit [Citrus sinensis]
MPGSDSTAHRSKSRRPKYSQFSQQELPAFKLILTPGYVISTFIVVGLIFVPIGLISLFASETVVEIVDQYDNECIPKDFRDNKVEFIKNKQTNKSCTRTFTVPKQMKSPIFIYYQLENFYQNHRRYVKSRSDKQLQSKKNAAHIRECKPMGETDNKDPIIPCGLIAWSLFNDTYGFSVKGKDLKVNKRDIAWGSDKNYKFGADVFPKNFQVGDVGGKSLNSSIPLSEQEDLIVWMRTAALSTFRKLYGKIEDDLQANDVITVVVENNYNTYDFKGTKSLVLSTTSWIGGKNDFLGVTFITIGGICLFLAITFILLYVIKPRPLGDPSYLSWNRNSTPTPGR